MHKPKWLANEEFLGTIFCNLVPFQIGCPHLVLDFPLGFEALFRRGLARVDLGQLAEGVADMKLAAKLSPEAVFGSFDFRQSEAAETGCGQTNRNGRIHCQASFVCPF